MSLFTDIADAIESRLDALGRFASGQTGTDQKASTNESMVIIAEEIIQQDRRLEIFEAYQTTAEAVNGGVLTFQQQRENDGYSFGGDVVIAPEDGRYAIDYSIGVQSDSAEYSVRGDILRNGTTASASAIFIQASGDVDSPDLPASGSSRRIILDLNASDEIAIRASVLVGTGIDTVPDATGITITRIDP